LNPEVLESFWLTVCASWEKIILAESLHDWKKVRRALFELYRGIFLTTEEGTENLSWCSRIVEDYFLSRFGRL
jgi:hypothetical protein